MEANTAFQITLDSQDLEKLAQDGEQYVGILTPEGQPKIEIMLSDSAKDFIND